MIILPGTPIYMFVVFNSLHHKMLVLHVIKWSKCNRVLSAYLFNSTQNSFAPTLLRPQSSRLFRTLRSRVYGMVIFLGNLNLCSICPLQYLPFAVFVLGSICSLQCLHLSRICPNQYLSFAVFRFCTVVIFFSVVLILLSIIRAAVPITYFLTILYVYFALVGIDWKF